MTHITIEYMIMIPMLILQIFLFPLTASWLMNIWVDSRRTLALQDAASHLGSTIQQLYFSLNHETISAGTATYSPGLPPFIEDYNYIGNATLRKVSGSANSSKVLSITVTLAKTKITVTTSVILGSNVLWRPSVFISNSTNALVSAEKLSNGTIRLYFGG
ncbi:MAG: hypothetical protein WAN82_00860 [Candidatus Bathyarchaeia archaeon]